MAVGDSNDILGRLKSVLPRWFGDSSPLLDALLKGLAQGHAFLYSLYVYAKMQTRIASASEGWLDMIAADFFGPNVLRAANQSDASYRAAIIANMFRERATRNAITLVLKALTGRAPVIVEPQRPADCGAYGIPNSGYGAAGAYGSMLIPYQAFVTAFRPLSSGVPNVAGYGVSSAGYGVASQGEYVSIASVTGAVLDADINAAIDAVKPAATTLWTRISS